MADKHEPVTATGTMIQVNYDQYTALVAENARLREALRWYADEDNYDDCDDDYEGGCPSSIDTDHGTRAREALGNPTDE